MNNDIDNLLKEIQILNRWRKIYTTTEIDDINLEELLLNLYFYFIDTCGFYSDGYVWNKSKEKVPIITLEEYADWIYTIYNDNSYTYRTALKCLENLKLIQKIEDWAIEGHTISEYGIKIIKKMLPSIEGYNEQD